MIHQISSIKTKTAALPQINRSLIQARHIQAEVKNRVAGHSLPVTGELWSPMTAGPYIVPITRWIE